MLRRHGAPLSNAQLARRSYMTPQAMSEVIDALAKKGLIKRNPHPNHGRLLPATLTARGRRVLAACEDAVDEMEDVMLAGLNTRERAAFRKALKSASAPWAPGSSTSEARARLGPVAIRATGGPTRGSPSIYGCFELARRLGEGWP